MDHSTPALFITILIASQAPALAQSTPWIVKGERGVVAADCPHASQVGADILRAGGNAIDAATAVSFALSVTRPQSTGVGGGGFLIARFADGRVFVQDFRETAPAAATANMFVRAAERSPQGASPAVYGHLAVGVPGLVAGRCQALALHGTMPLDKVIAPAVKLARDGFPIDQHYVESAAEIRKVYESHPELKETCGYVWRTHLADGRPRNVGETLVQPQLARLLETIAREGPEGFYRGPVAQAIAEEMRRHGGLITEQDLADYRVKSREPLRFRYRDFSFIAMPPPSSGGVALAEALHVLEALDFQGVVARDPGLAWHYQVEAFKHAFADRARWLGDADFVPIPLSWLMSEVYARELAANINPFDISDTNSYGAIQLPNDGGTSHFSIVDRLGNVVVSTESVNTEFGSLAAIEEWGLVLNNTMDDFVTDPRRPNAYGLVQSMRNAVAPGKRPLSSMVPTIILQDDKPYLMLGASGGPRIITSVLDVLLNVLDRGFSLEQAMAHARPHHQWQPDEVFFDAEPPAPLMSALASRGHQLTSKRKTGIVQAILRIDNGWIAASDPRKGGRPAAE